MGELLLQVEHRGADILGVESGNDRLGGGLMLWPEGCWQSQECSQSGIAGMRPRFFAPLKIR